MSDDQKTPSRFLKFDNTVNWPFILTLGAIVVGAIGFGNTVVNQIGSIQVSLQEQKVADTQQTQEVKGLRESIDNIRLDMAKQDGMRSMVIDHESRIRALENKQP